MIMYLYLIHLQIGEKMKDIKFSVAIHILIMLATSDKPLNSEDLAKSVGTNASYIRKIMALLKKSNIITSQRGKSGTKLLVSPDKLTLLMIYQAVEADTPHIFQIHQNANPACPIGRNIKQTVFPFLEEAEQQLRRSLAQDTLQNVIERLKKNEQERRKNESSTTN